MKYHTELLHTDAPGGGKPKAAAAPEPGAAAAKAPTLDFTAPVTVNNPYGGGQVQVSGLDFTAGATSKSAAAGAIVDPPEDLDMGRTWVEFRPKGAPEEQRALKLLFVPPKKTRYVFTDRKGKTFLELTRAELVRQLRTGEAVRLEGEPEEPLFDRIMHGLVDKLRAPASPAA